MKVLVTGGRSLLGTGVARTLAARGDDVVLLQRTASALPYDEVLGDVADPQVVARAVAGCEVVVHLAARVGVNGRWADFVRTNVDGTATVLAEARAAGVRGVVHVSSPSVAHGGTALVGVGAGPADAARAHGSYARSKAMAETLALDVSRASGPPVVVVRPHLVWGPGDTQLVGRIVDRARSGRLALVGRGTALIDTTYVDNAVDALVAAVDRVDALAGRAFVVSNGEPRTVAELVERICVAAGVAPPRLHVPYPMARAGGALAETAWSVLRRDDDPPMTRFLAEQLATAHWFDQRETREALGWRPAVSLDEGFARLAAAYQAR